MNQTASTCDWSHERRNVWKLTGVMQDTYRGRRGCVREGGGAIDIKTFMVAMFKLLKRSIMIDVHVDT